MTKRAKQFMAANAESPVTSSAWLDKDKKPPKGIKSADWIYRRVQLASGDVFMLDPDDQTALREAGYRDHWSGMPKPPMTADQAPPKGDE